MKTGTKKGSLIILVIVMLLLVHLLTGTASAISLPQCITDSNDDPLTIINSAPCGIFGGSVTTRKTNVNRTEVDVSVKYMVHVPNGTPKGLVVLFSGRVGNAGIQGNQKGGAVTSAGQNFLVRSAQLFAEEGYLAVSIDRPSTSIGFPILQFLQYDRYRVSPKHAQDIVAVLHDLPNVVPDVDTTNLDLLLAGISRGAISTVAQSKLSNGISIQSPVTSGNTLFVGCTAPAADPTDVTSCLRLQPSFLKVPVGTLAHAQDGCERAQHVDSVGLHTDFRHAGVESHFESTGGGFDLGIDACGNLAFHSFLGIETKAVGKITKRLDKVLEELDRKFPGNNKPIANPGNISTIAPTAVIIDLSTLANDPDGDSLTYSLSHPISSRDAALSISGSVVTYTPAGAGITDGFVYIVTDGKGGKSSAVVSVVVNSP